MRRPQKFAKSSPYFWLQYIQSKVRGRFRKILWPSQNIWTLTVKYLVCFFLQIISHRIYQENQSFISNATLKTKSKLQMNDKISFIIFERYLKSLDLVTRSRSHSWAKISNKKKIKNVSLKSPVPSTTLRTVYCTT